MRVLIADDNRNFGLFVRSSLMTRGYQARAVGSAAEALQAVCEDRYDLFIVDAALRDPDGRTLAESLAASQNVPADHIVLTTDADPPPNNGSRVLHKPFRLEALLQILHDLVPQ